MSTTTHADSTADEGTEHTVTTADTSPAHAELIRGTPAQRLERIREQHAARRRYNDEHLARMRRAAGAILGTSKGLAAAPGPALASAATIDATSPWPIIIDGVPLPWIVDGDVRVDARSDTDGMARLWVGILTDALDIAAMPINLTPGPGPVDEARAALADLARERDLLHNLLQDERDEHNHTITRLTRARRHLTRVREAAARLTVERDEARHMAMRAEVALTDLAGDRSTLALAVVEAGGPGAAMPGSIELQATQTLKRLNAALALATVQVQGLTAERDALLADLEEAHQVALVDPVEHDAARAELDRLRAERNAARAALAAAQERLADLYRASPADLAADLAADEPGLDPHADTDPLFPELVVRTPPEAGEVAPDTDPE